MIKKGDIINVVVKDFAFGGKGIATYKVDDKSIIVFINFIIAPHFLLMSL